MSQPLGARLLAFVREARSRKVYTAALAYLALAMVLLQVGPAIFSALALPQGSDRVLTVLLLLGFPIVVVLAWIFDIGPGGLHRTATTEEDAVVPATGASWSVPAEEPEEEPSAEPEELPSEPLDPERMRRASLGFVRHELRTPINAIIGYSEMLLEDAADTGADTTVLAQVRAGGRELLAHVEEILAAERIEAETRDVASYAVQLHSGLRAPLEEVIGSTGQLIEEDRAAGGSARLGDLERICSAAKRLRELSENVEAVAERGPAAAAAPAGRVSALAEGVLAKIRPLSANAADEERQGTLLVVDDSPINRDLLAKQLARRGYLVATAENGRQALERLGEQDFDLVLLDIIMPELDGIEVLRRIKADARLREIPVIMISALDEIDSVIRCLEIGAADFLSKPFHPTLLDARISANLAARRTQARERATRNRAQTVAPGRELVIGGLPPSVLSRLRAGDRRPLDSAQRAAVLWCDVSRLTGVRPEPQARAAALDQLMERVRAAATAHRCECAIGQGTGIALIAGFTSSVPDPVRRVAAAALGLHGGGGVQLRLGLHAGGLCGAVVGTAEPSYWLWGDALELARGLAAEAPAGGTLVSAAAHGDLKEHFVSTGRGVIEVPGRGQTRAWSLDRAAPTLVGG
jgi:CheY-like chemotaxis protein